MSNRFKEMVGNLKNEETTDMQKRNNYGQKWNRPPSSLVNRSYFNQIELYQKKS